MNFADLSLLVGVSGVGKTQTLRAIVGLRNVILNGEALNGVSWELNFSINEKNYIWAGEFEKVENECVIFKRLTKKAKEKNDEIVFPKIKSEELRIDNKIVVKRDQKELHINGKKSFKISPYESAIKVFSEEQIVTPIVQEFRNIYFFNLDDESHRYIRERGFEEFNNRCSDIEKLKSVRLPILLKLGIASRCHKKIFESIKKTYIEIFPKVEDFRFVKIKDEDGESLFTFEIREKNTEWISQKEISTGMMKTLLFISKIMLCANGSVIIVDEYENGLGINCIDVVADLLMENKERVQFIISSHHPYIINRIPMQYWKIIYRDGSSVDSKTAEELGIGRSKHEAFKQLINNTLINEGAF